MTKKAYIRLLSFVISIASLAIASLHVAFPKITIDAITSTFLILAALPWLAPIIKSVKMPGGFEIELQDVREATEAAIEASTPPPVFKNLKGRASASSQAKGTINLQAAADMGIEAQVGSGDEKAIAHLKSISKADPNLALVGFRIEIEKRLRELASRNAIDDHRDLPFVINQLHLRGTVPSTLLSALSDLIALGNKAVHGESVDPAVAPWIFNQGTSVLNVLDKFMARHPTGD